MGEKRNPRDAADGRGRGQRWQRSVTMADSSVRPAGDQEEESGVGEDRPASVEELWCRLDEIHRQLCEHLGVENAR
jgi:hypothetical protein